MKDPFLSAFQPSTMKELTNDCPENDWWAQPNSSWIIQSPKPGLRKNLHVYGVPGKVSQIVPDSRQTHKVTIISRWVR